MWFQFLEDSGYEDYPNSAHKPSLSWRSVLDILLRYTPYPIYSVDKARCFVVKTHQVHLFNWNLLDIEPANQSSSMLCWNEDCFPSISCYKLRSSGCEVGASPVPLWSTTHVRGEHGSYQLLFTGGFRQWIPIVDGWFHGTSVYKMDENWG